MRTKAVKPEKIERVRELRELIGKAGALYFIDFTGLTVAEMGELRKKVKERGGLLRVVKNTLMRIALREAGLPQLAEGLVGPNAVLFAFEDEIEPLKAATTHFKEIKKGKVKMGFFEGELYDEKGVAALAKIPSSQELRAQVVGSLSGLMGGLVWSLEGLLASLVWALEEIKEKQGG